MYEEEKCKLQECIVACLAEEEYLLAHYHSEALHRLNSGLHTLYSLSDRLYDEKSFAQRCIERWERQIETVGSDHMREYFENEIRKAREELERLNKALQQPEDPGNAHLLNELLAQLMQKKIKNLRLILSRKDNLTLRFNYSKNVLKVTLPSVKELTKNWVLSEDRIDSFRNLGFDLMSNDTKLVLTLAGNREDVLCRMGIILSKIVFEIFYFREFDKETYIQFTDKADG